MSSNAYVTRSLALLLAAGIAVLPAAGEPAAGDPVAEQETPLRVVRAGGDIVIDGELSEAAWREAPMVEVWYETNRGDNVEPQVVNKAYLLYDDSYFYAGFELEDPEPDRIRAPLGDHDNLPGYTDYAGILLDTNNDGKTVQMFLANVRGIKYDAILSDVTGEDDSPDYFWDAAGKVNGRGWTLEIRVPLSSLRYSAPDWRILLYRNYPRDFRYQFFSSRLPRDVSCFICNARPLVGLQDLPTGGHFIVAPVVVANQASEPEGDLGTPLKDGDADVEPSIDVKWIPNPNTVIDLTWNPDFSQIESDTAQISANERFALFFPEKRPFFLEGADLFKTPIQAVYSRTFTAPRWGTRATGRTGKNAYTFLIGEDEGGGSTILPGPSGSGLAEQGFESFVAMGRLRRDVGERSFLSFLVTGREIDGGGSNYVFGPDFQWRPNDHDTVTGQVLLSQSDTPDRPDLAEEWDGRELGGHAAKLWWYHQTENVDAFLEYNDVGDEFRADDGFVPRVGYREGVGELGYTFRPEHGLPKDGFLTAMRPFLFVRQSEDREGALLERTVAPAVMLNGRWDLFSRILLFFNEVESGGQIFSRTRYNYILFLRPSRRFSQIGLEASFGDEVDFTHSRPGQGTRITATAISRLTDHVELQLNLNRNSLDLKGGQRLFTAQTARLRGVYAFNSRSWIRAIVQYVETERDPSLYVDEVAAKDASLSGSLLFAYKINWQSVLFVGYGDDRVLDEHEELQPTARQLFLKISYAFQK